MRRRRAPRAKSGASSWIFSVSTAGLIDRDGAESVARGMDLGYDPGETVDETGADRHVGWVITDHLSIGKGGSRQLARKEDL